MPVQRVRRVIRKVDPWTVLKVSLVFNAIMALVFVLGTVIFWSVFVNAGIPERINELALLVGIENGITLDGPVYFRIVVLLAVIGTILLTGFMTLGAVIYNLISDLVGGVEVVVLEETAVPHATRAASPVTGQVPAASKRSGPPVPKTTAKNRGGVSPTVRQRQQALPNVKPFRSDDATKEQAPAGAPDTIERTGTSGT